MNQQLHLTGPAGLHWRRIGATSTTIAVHLLLGLVLLLPTTPPLPVHASIAPPTAVHIIEPEPKKIEPVHVAEPVVLHPRPRPVVHPVTPPTPPMPVENTEPTSVSLPPAPLGDSGPAELPRAMGRTESVGYRGSTHVPYPKDALRAHEQGKVVLNVLVAVDGSVQSIEVAQSSGSARLDRAAREAVLHWHFAAAIENDVPKAAWALVPIAFSLSNE